MLAERVHIANPVRFPHPHLVRPRRACARCSAVVQRSGFDAVGFMLDCPPRRPGRRQRLRERASRSSSRRCPGAPSRAALISSLPESLAAATRELCLPPASCRCRASARRSRRWISPARSARAGAAARQVELRRPRSAAGSARAPLSEHEAKARSPPSACRVPRSARGAARDAVGAADGARLPGRHQGRSRRRSSTSPKSAAWSLNVRTPAARRRRAASASRALSDTLLVEEMITDGVAEILVGITSMPQFGQMLVLGAGGVLTELLRDSVSLLPPFTRGARSKRRSAGCAWHDCSAASAAARPATCRRWWQRSSPAPATPRPTRAPGRARRQSRHRAPARAAARWPSMR